MSATDPHQVFHRTIEGVWRIESARVIAGICSIGLRRSMERWPAGMQLDVPMEGNIFWNFLYPWTFYTANAKGADDLTYNLQRPHRELIAACDREIAQYLEGFESKGDPPSASPSSSKDESQPKTSEPRFDLQTHFHRILGVDLTQVPGTNVLTTPTLWRRSVLIFPASTMGRP